MSNRKTKLNEPVLWTLCVLLVIGAFFYFSSKPKKLSLRHSENSIEASPVQNNLATKEIQNTTNQIPPSATVSSNSETVSKQGHRDDENEPTSVTSTDTDGNTTQVIPRKKKDAKEILERNHNLNPNEEFNSLTPIEFNNEESNMFAGVFVDPQSKIKIAIYYDGDTYKLHENSCVIAPDGTQFPSQNNQLQMRDDKYGYAAIIIKQNWYMRMAYVFSPNRTLIGKLYKKSGNDWSFVTDFNAVEVSSSAPLKTCVFP